MICVVLLATILLSIGSLTAGQSSANTCTNGRVSLASLPTLTYTVGNDLYTLGLCNAVQPTFSTLAQCAVAGYVLLHNAATGGCRTSYNTIVTGLTRTTTGAWFVVSDATPTATINVSFICDRTLTAGSAVLVSPVATSTNGTGFTTTTITLRSLSGCALDTFFCNANVSCADTTKSCLSGVCFRPSCTTLTLLSSTVVKPADFISSLTVADCDGVPLPSANSTAFSVTLNGVSVTDPTLAGETPLVVDTLPSTPNPQLTTLLVDQSISVWNSTAQAALKQAATSFVNSVISTNSNHFIALIAFDGAASPVVVLPHTNNRATIVAAIANSLPPANQVDGTSTNLYGAVIDGLDGTSAQ